MKDLQVNDEIEVGIWSPGWDIKTGPVVEGVIWQTSKSGRRSVRVTREVRNSAEGFTKGSVFILHDNDIIKLIGGLENE